MFFLMYIYIYTHEHVSCVSFSVGEDISESGRRHKSSLHRLQSVFTYGDGLIVKKSDDGQGCLKLVVHEC